jgi:phosphohistidine swiveling domain-containing protein
MGHRLLSLDAPRARDVDVAGSKAASLSRARAVALPALPGWVVPADEATRSVAVGAARIEGGSADACGAVGSIELDDGLLADLAVMAGHLGGSSIVRSSTVQEADRRWAGGFSTYHDIPIASLSTAIRGCWASAFTRDAVRRREELRERAEDVRIAVLIQPWIAFDRGGTASAGASGNVVVSWVRGGPAGLMAGRGGTTIEVDGDGRSGSAPPAGMAGILAHVARLHRAVVREGLGDCIEWGARGDDVVLLQVDRSGRADARRIARVRGPIAALGSSDVAQRLAVAASLFPAPLGEELVLPWATAPGASLDPSPCRVTDRLDALREARALAERLTSRAWGGRSSMMSAEIATTFRELLGNAPWAALDRLSRLRPVDQSIGRRVMSLMDAIAIAGGDSPSPTLLGPDRWEPFVFDVTRSQGHVRHGTPVSPAIGAGWIFAPNGPNRLERTMPRRVLVMRDPVPQAAPLLWGCAGLVTAGGSMGAHLFEVARSLGVPAVAGVDLTRVLERTLIAVDGHTGHVSTWTPNTGRAPIRGPQRA